MNFLQTFRVNTPAVVSETFDDEIVIINLDSGAYYSIDQSGAFIWNLLQQGVTSADIMATIATTSAITVTALEEQVQHFIEELKRENLIIPTNTALETSRPQRHKQAAVTAHGQNAFSTPHLHKYTDMQDLLLLDPIHDVTENGWPHVNAH